MSVLVIIGFVFAGIAAAIHVYIFVLESLLWTRPSTRRIFGVRTDAETHATQPLAFNQGFYNLFLAAMVAVGIPLAATASLESGAALVLAGTASMLLAAIVLVSSRPSMLRAAVIQGAAPLIAIVLVVLGLAISATTTGPARADGFTPLETDAPVAGLPAGVQDSTGADFAVVVDDTRIVVVTFGSSTCPRVPAGYDANSPTPFRLVSDPSDGMCTADYVATSTSVPLPRGIYPVTAVELDGTALPVVAG